MVLLLTVAAALVAVLVSATLGDRALIVRSGSMGQTAPLGSLVLVHAVPSEAVRVGTIVVLQPKPTARKVVPPTLHRAIEVKHTPQGVLVRTKGDANLVADPDPNLLGRTALTPVHVIPYLGYLIGANRTLIGWLLLLVVPGALLLMFALRSIWTAPGVRPDDVTAADQSRASEPDLSIGGVGPVVGVAVGDIILAAERAAAAIRSEAEERLRAADEEAQMIVLRARHRADGLIREVKRLAVEQIERQRASSGRQPEAALDDHLPARGADTSSPV
ncbi:MAG: signal peptidase I [Actinomycetota bacterium]|nr:signal peptidase I [Actinomycetota bacterium]